MKNCYTDPRDGETKIYPWSDEELVDLAVHLGLRNESHRYWFMQRCAKWRWTPFVDKLRPEVNALTDRATLYIQKWYPEFQYNPTLPRDGYGRIGHWWEIEDRQPLPEECPGNPRHQGTAWQHPANGTWCQYCGWRQEDEDESG
jgi:hypothetical protein